MGALYKGLVVSGIISAVGFYFIINRISVPDADFSKIKLYLASLVGLLVAGGMVVITEYFTSKNHGPVQTIAKASESGHGTNVITGLAIGMKATAPPVILIVAGILLSFWLLGDVYGIYGIAIAAMAMLSLAGIIVAIDAYGPITDNA